MVPHVPKGLTFEATGASGFIAGIRIDGLDRAPKISRIITKPLPIQVMTFRLECQD
jgi:hypothetical protein